jgi:hypothetical protein
MHLIRTIVGLMNVRCRRRALFGFLSAIANACPCNQSQHAHGHRQCVRRYQTILDVLNGDDPLYQGAEVSRRDIVTMLAGFARVYAPNQVPT